MQVSGQLDTPAALPLFYHFTYWIRVWMALRVSVDVLRMRQFLQLSALMDAVKKQTLLPLPGIKPQFQKCELKAYFILIINTNHNYSGVTDADVHVRI
jgi:hypothetical protein